MKKDYRILFTEHISSDRYLVFLTISSIKCPNSDVVVAELQSLTDHTAIQETGKKGVEQIMELYKKTYPDLNYIICKTTDDLSKGVTNETKIS